MLKTRRRRSSSMVVCKYEHSVVFSSGTLGPVAFGLSFRDSCLVDLFFNLLFAIPPAYFST
ncbi:hypothetical protein EDB85DRAFT_1928441 [Lactarius pseudohatsudake]|nr:hypothetical protein EDB85DRAFT_1928441 [Lactarius pseudohatsudake]